MARIYKSKDGDMLDEICWRYYGTSVGMVEVVLAENPNLSGNPEQLEAGIDIVLPDIEPPQQNEISLF